jgi:hypothetical protein
LVKEQHCKGLISNLLLDLKMETSEGCQASKRAKKMGFEIALKEKKGALK